LQNLFEDFVSNSDLLGRIMRYQAQHSATSPITAQAG